MGRSVRKQCVMFEKTSTKVHQTSSSVGIKGIDFAFDEIAAILANSSSRHELSPNASLNATSTIVDGFFRSLTAEECSFDNQMTFLSLSRNTLQAELLRMMISAYVR